MKLSQERTSLISLFLAWKIILLAIIFTSAYPGYDTSTTLLLQSRAPDQESTNTIQNFLHVSIAKLTRWDAIYFAQISQRGALFEQEWAFGWGFVKLLSAMGRRYSGFDAEVIAMAAAGIFASNVSHLLSVLLLYQLSVVIAAPLNASKSSRVAFMSASLHIISPAGIFLSAPYAESSCSLMNFAGFYSYAYSLQAQDKRYLSLRDGSVMLSGVFFGLATSLRSNGLLSGLIFGHDIIQCLLAIRRSGELVQNLRRSAFLAIAAIFTATGFLVPQYLAYWEFCSSSGHQPLPLWCTNRVPSIYTWIITRISSGYPLWYWWLASMIDDQREIGMASFKLPSRVVVKWMMIYALVQAGLFAAFLPPA
ncbi:MAG: hypothetical protein Q9219_002153 [cf. Caloplaca sp. 3 TL-2023]